MSNLPMCAALCPNKFQPYWGCMNSARHTWNGVPLCKTHLNAYVRQYGTDNKEKKE